MITTWIVNHQQPLLIIEDSELVNIFQYINPTVNLPKADTIKNAIIHQYIQGKKDLQASFFNAV